MSDAKAEILITDTNSKEYLFDKIISFNFNKSVSTPYTTLSAVFLCDDIFVEDISAVLLKINNIEIHKGYIETFSSYIKNGCRFISLTSKSFTSLMMQSYLKPGLYTSITFNSLMENYISMPFVTHENNSEKTSYIYVSENKSFWDSVCSFGYKTENNLPYITETNKVNISLPSSPDIIVLSSDNFIEAGRISDYREIVSDIYMQDAEGEYDKFYLHCNFADNLNISRRKEIPLDMQFLYSPQSALDYRMMQYLQKSKLFYFICKDFFEFELFNKIKTDIFSDTGEIYGIRISGNGSGVLEKVWLR